MKIYTEEQVRKVIEMARITQPEDLNVIEDRIINSLTPIELPSDEEIEDIIRPFEFEYTRIGFKACANWMRDKILNK